MKKIISGLLLVAAGHAATAQIGQGGVPLTPRQADRYVPTSQYALPDWQTTLKKAELEETAGKPRPYLVGLFTPSDISFPGSGTLLTQDDGSIIWQAQISIAGAPAIGLYYDKFELPKGVKYYVTNAAKTQMLGAYTADNNAPSGYFANEAVQGNIVNLQMEIEPGVDLNNIRFHIDRSAVYFRNIAYLAGFAIDPGQLHEIDQVDNQLAGRSSACMINAVCPLGANYQIQRKAILQTVIPIGNQGVGLCSATMVNNTGNTTASCKHYVLTATHCDQENSTASSHFDQLLLRFNFEQPTCTGTAIPESNTLTGANFVARANYNASASANDIKGDFLLLELRSNLPSGWNVNLAGWNNNPNLPSTVAAPKKYIGFHHPNGDVKKVSSAQSIESTPLQPSAPEDTHWAMQLDSGLVSSGSSGSGLFDGDGYLVGIASVAGDYGVPANCKKNAAGVAVTGTANVIFYSKFAYDWDYTVDGSATNRKLKPWLDPVNTGAVRLEPVKSDCSSLGTNPPPMGIGGTGETLSSAIGIYPNPSRDGKVTVQINLPAAVDMTMDLYEVNGKKIRSYQLKQVRSGLYPLNLDGLSNGIYLLQCSDGQSLTGKKIMIAR
ncbi:T9SS type A sorting domain-containing protein [Taibaiella koreensis]|uniref:T9SS type A sorting domain-containing protein n=1 Tax=Taibaiella koreensis TaxID=1268548 RepID=UPI000E59EC9D|nr:T9SS type A sorting domain-containing protein [Taibaiella koreensis]